MPPERKAPPENPPNEMAVFHLQRIAKLANVLVSHSCGERYDNEIRMDLCNLLRSFRDDSFTELKASNKSA